MLGTLMNGGWVMVPLAICSIVSIAIIIERFFFFARIDAGRYADEVLELAEQGRVEEARVKSKGINLPLVKVLEIGLSSYRQPAKAMEAASMEELSGMRRGLPALDTIITLSPLLGLLGTIIGMIGSFQIMAVAGMGQPHAVTGGVGEALIATAAGITVAVVTLIPYNYFLARIERETEKFEQYATKLELVLNELP